MRPWQARKEKSQKIRKVEGRILYGRDGNNNNNNNDINNNNNNIKSYCVLFCFRLGFNDRTVTV